MKKCWLFLLLAVYFTVQNSAGASDKLKPNEVRIAPKGSVKITEHDKRINPCGWHEKPTTFEISGKQKLTFEAMPPRHSSHLKSPTGWRIKVGKKVYELPKGVIEVNVGQKILIRVGKKELVFHKGTDILIWNNIGREYKY